MSNLTTRKIVLGMLMTLVLAFSVQGIADALTLDTPDADSNDLQDVGVGEFTVVFDVTVVGAAELKNSRYEAVPSVNLGTNETDTPYYYIDDDPDNDDSRQGYQNERRISNSAANYNNNEAVRITVRGANIVGLGDSGDDITATTGHTLLETAYGTGNTLLSAGTNTLRFSASRAGIVTITVSDATPNEDFQSGTRRGDSITFTTYIVKHSLDINFNDTVTLLGVTNGVGAGYDNRQPVKIHSGDNKHNPVTYSVTGGGNLYVQAGSDTNRTLALEGQFRTSSSADVWLNMVNNSNTVTAQVTNGDRKNQGVYIYGRPTLRITTPDTATNSFLEGAPGSVSTNRITAVVYDRTTAGVIDTTAVLNVPLEFDVADKNVTGGYLIPPSSADSFPNDDFSDNITDTNGSLIRQSTLTNLLPARTLYVRTNATVGFQFGTAPGRSEVSVSISGRNVSLTETAEVRVTGGTATALSRGDNSRRSGNNKLFDLVAVVEEDGEPVRGITVTFQTRFGALTNTPTGEALSGGFPGDNADTQEDSLQVTDITDRLGKAQVIYNLGSSTGRQEIDASIYDSDNNLRQEITFVVNGPAPTRTTTTTTTTTTEEEEEEEEEETETLPGSLSIDVTGTGATRSITVTATDGVRNIPGVTVTLRGSALTQGQRTVTVGTPITITLPTAPGDYNLEAAANGFTTSPVETFTVTDGSAPRTPAPTSGGRTLTVEKDGAQTGTQQPIRVRATPAPSRNLAFTVTRDDARVGVGLILTTGTGTAIVTVPATGLYVLTVSAEGYTPKQVTFTAGTGTPTVSETPTSTSTAGDPSRIEIDGASTRSGTEDTELEDPLRVRVLDDDGDAVADARVIFRVRSGQGRLSQRGNGRATSANTNSRGYAAADYTPLSASSTVSASVNGVPLAVTFTITTGSAAAGQSKTYKTGDKIPISLDGTLTFSGSRTLNGTVYRCVGSGECVVSYGTLVKGEIQVSTVTTPGTGERPRPIEINPMVRVNAANRPPMLWVDGGAIYALVGASVQKFAPGVDNALNIAVGGGKVYWTEKTGESGGTINSANLNGTGVTELASIFATPIGIAVDTDASKLYWTNSAGRIQSANLDGSRITNVLPNLPSPMDIALAGGNAYWTQGGNVRFVNLKGQKVVRNVSTGADAAGSLVIGGGKVYWTEMTGESGGTVNSANLNGTGATELASILAAPSGIAVDGARSKLYWTNSRGRIQSANLDGSKIQNVVDGLGSPGELVLSNSIAETPAATTTTRTTTTASKYDVNGDGKVDSADSDAVTVAIAAGATDAKYDVNGDGTVNVFDLVEIIANRDPGAAGAPTLFGMKMSAVQIDLVQEQIDLLIATNDRSPAAMRVLVYLQQLLVTARPEKTQLLANYPNPFNPETWIPYELATDTDVRLTIYNTQGVVIRSLQLGHQSGGYYTGRDRAAYWDGRNALGEQVASGLYFYQLETDEMSLMRKMVILK